MYQTRAPKKTGSFTLKLSPIKWGCCVPISVQIQQSAIVKRHDKRRTREKAKAWVRDF